MNARPITGRLALLSTVAVGAVAISTSANAAAEAAPAAPEGPTGAVTEMIVTAQRRSETVQNVPITITALDSVSIAKAHVESITDLVRVVPTLKYGIGPGGFNSRFNMRGLGSPGSSAVEASIALFVDGIYVPRPANEIRSFLDIAGVEVLSGPQGTLFGRNASAGMIILHTPEPGPVFGGVVNAEAGTGGHYKVDGAVDLPVNDRLAFRAAAQADILAGYWKNDLNNSDFGGSKTYSGRLSMRARLTDNLEWVLRGDYQEVTGDGSYNSKLIPATLTSTTLAAYTALNNGIAPTLNLYSTHNNSYLAGSNMSDSNGNVTSELRLKTNSGYELKLLDGYRDSDQHEINRDATSASVPILGRDSLFHSRSQSHELQLSSPKHDLLGNRFDFVAGIYYFKENLRIDIKNDLLSNTLCGTIAPPPSRPACLAGQQTGATDANYNQKTDSIAGYTQGTFAIAPTLDLTGGVRWTRDKKDATYVGTPVNAGAAFLVAAETTPLSQSQSKPTYRANLSWSPVDRVMLFATYSTGFKSGGFNSNGSAVQLGQARQFSAETVDNYEAGFKAQFWDRRLLLDATAWQMNVRGYQERAQDGSGNAVVRNVGDVRNKGIDAQLVLAPTPNFKVNTSVSYLDTTFLSYPSAPCFTGQTAAQGCVSPPPHQDLKGTKLTYSPKFSGTVGAEANGDAWAGLRWQANLDMQFTSSQNLNAQIDNSPQAIQAAYSLVNARVALSSKGERWTLAVFANNLADKGYCTSIAYQPLDGPYGLRFAGGTALRCFVGAPRTVGARLSTRF